MDRVLTNSLVFIFIFILVFINIDLYQKLNQFKKHPDKIEIFLKPTDTVTHQIKEIEETHGVSLIVTDYENSQVKHALSYLSTTSNLFGKFLTIIVIMISLYSAFGVFEVSFWRNQRKAMEEGEVKIVNFKGQIDTIVSEMEQNKNDFTKTSNEISLMNKKSSEQIEILKNLIDDLNIKQKALQNQNLKFTEFENNLNLRYEDYKNRVIQVLDQIREIKDSNAKDAIYSDNIKTKLKELRMFHNIFGVIIESIEIEEESNKMKNLEYFALGMAAYFEKDFEDSKRFFQKAIEYNENDYISYMRLATILFYLKEYDSAIASFEKSIAIKPDFHIAYYNMGHAYRKMGELEKAIENYKKAISHKKYYISAYNNLIIVYIQTNNFEKALSTIDTVLDIDSTNEKAYYNKACIFSRNKNRQETLINLEKAITLEESLKKYARSDKDFLWLNSDSQFQKLIS